jgi:hypothetical protein
MGLAMHRNKLHDSQAKAVNGAGQDEGDDELLQDLTDFEKPGFRLLGTGVWQGSCASPDRGQSLSTPYSGLLSIIDYLA